MKKRNHDEVTDADIFEEQIYRLEDGVTWVNLIGKSMEELKQL
jgi:hypothetical protein